MSTATVGASPNNTPVSRGTPAENSRTRPSSFISFLFICISIELIGNCFLRGRSYFARPLVLSAPRASEFMG